MEFITIGQTESKQHDLLRERFEQASKRQRIAELIISRVSSGIEAQDELRFQQVIEDNGLCGDPIHEIEAPQGKVIEITADSLEQGIVRVDAISPIITLGGMKKWLAHDRLLGETHEVEGDAVAKLTNSFIS